MPSSWISVLSRCGICSFEVEKGEKVIAVYPDGQQSRKYPFDADQCFKDALSGVEYDSLHWENWNINDLAVGCHSKCIRHEPSRSVPSRERFEALTYNYFPSKSELDRRKRWLLSDYAVTLHGILRPRYSVPLEICELIAGHCSLRYWAATVARRTWDEAPRVKDHSFNITTKLWARYVEFEGLQYIACLTNDPGDLPASLIHEPKSDKKPIELLYIAEDYMGIREVHFHESSQAVPTAAPRPGIWWKRMTIPGLCGFETRTDGLKIRTLCPLGFQGHRMPPVGEAADSDAKYAFDVPLTPKTQLWWFDFRFTVIRSRMAAFFCNDPNTIGYSVLCDRLLYHIRSHVDGDDDVSFYSDLVRPNRHTAVWLHFPVDPEERITEIWARNWEDDVYTEDNALILRTSKNRTWVLGSYPSLERGEYQYTPLSRPPAQGPCRVYVDSSVYRINTLAVEAPLPQSTGQQPVLPRPTAPYPVPGINASSGETYVYASAALQSVVEVTPCRVRVVEFGEAIVGILLRYADGHRESLGQVRLDMLEPPLQGGIDEGGMWLNFRYSELGCPNIGSITFDGPDGSDSFYVPWSGTLQWWFSHLQCRVWHEGRASPPTRLVRRLAIRY